MKKYIPTSSSRGSALLLVLGCVALLTVLVLSFLASTSTERNTSTFYSRGISTSLLSENVLNLVTAQIHQGTLSTDSNPSAGGATVAWASQPGMIRTYTPSGASSYYKLFSSDVMVGSGAYTAATDSKDVPPSDWSNLSSVYTDLNSPINNVYPIVDNNNLVGGYKDPVSGTSGLETYGSTTNPAVEGFTLNPNTTFSSTANPVAMPVQWIYVLQDGTLTAPTWTDGIDKVTVTAASATNPIVGRIAFWTDDETCKVNINTASEGSFWDIPFADGVNERTLAYNLPVKGEYNRIPGHPATVSLSSLFKDIYTPSFPGSLTFNPVYYPASATPNDVTPVQNLLALTPRTLFGGSQFGTQPNALLAETTSTPTQSAVTPMTSYGRVTINNVTVTLPPPPAGAAAVDNKANRLYSSVDELLYGTSTTAVTSRVSNPPADTATNPNSIPLTSAIVQRSRFFATAKSRAPEVTLFNTPRVSMWPITWPWTATAAAGASPVPDVVNSIQQNTWYTNTSAPMLQSTEKLLAYCGTVGGWPYYFQRQDAYSSTNDWTYIQRNQELIAYLQTLTGNTIPGYGGKFSDKYGPDRDQILTEMLDYIRSGPDLNNNTTVVGTTTTISNYDFAPINNRMIGNFSGPSSIFGGVVVPLVINSLGTKGAGRFATIRGVSLVFYAADRYKVINTTTGQPTAGPDVYTPEPAATNTGTVTAFQRHFVNFPGAWKIGASNQNNLLLTQKYGMQTTSLGMYMVFDSAQMSPGYITDTLCYVCRLVPSNGGSTYGTIAVNAVAGTNPGASWTATFDLPNSAGKDYNSFLANSNNNSGGYLGGGGVSSWETFLGCTRALGDGLAKSFTRGNYDPRRYPLFSTPVPVDPQGGDLQFQLTASDMAVEIYSVDPTTVNSKAMTKGDLIQTIQLPLSKLNGIYPMPCAPAYDNTVSSTAAHPIATMSPPSVNPAPSLSATLTITSSGSLNYYHTSTGTVTFVPIGNGTTPANSSYIQFPSIEVNGMNFPINTSAATEKISNYMSDDTLSTTTNGAITALKDPITNNNYSTNPFNQYTDSRNLQMRACQSAMSGGIWGSVGGYSGAILYQPTDTAISLVLDPINGTAGDLRVLALTGTVPSSNGGWFVPHYGVPAMQNSTTPAGSNGIEAVSLAPAGNRFAMGYWMFETKFGSAINSYFTTPPFIWSPQMTVNTAGLPNNPPLAPIVIGDFAAAAGNMLDGAEIPKPDDSNWIMGIDGDGGLQIPYYGGYNGEMNGNEPYFSPARQISGPIAFGVLPTGVKATAADIISSSGTMSQNTWRTLAFEPNPAIANLVATPPAVPAGHLGLQSPPDYLLLDDFWMPVVEPYAISEPLSTAGKINLNYQIVPFSHITRRTGLYAAMKSDVITAIPAKAAMPNEASYKEYILSNSGTNTWGFRYPVDVAHTLELLDYQSKQNNRLFLSPAEICSVYLVPQRDQVGSPYALGGVIMPAMTGTPSSDLTAVQKWWQAYSKTSSASTGSSSALTGVNARQQPYAHLYSLLTTKSNTFQVHMRVQLLKKAQFANADPTSYDESKGDRVVGEYRGSAIIERYVDPADPNLAGVDFAAGGNAFTGPGASANTLDRFYKYRVTSVNAFTP